MKWFSLVLLFGLIFGLTNLNIFKVKKIVCQLDAYPCPLSFEPVLVNFSNQNIFTISRRLISKKLSDFDPTLTAIKISKKLPNQLLIVINHRQPIAQLAVFSNLEFTGWEATAAATIAGEISDKFWLMDQQGEIYNSSSPVPGALPLVAVTDNFNQQKIFQLLTLLKEHYVAFNLLAWIDPDIFVIKTNLGPYAIINAADFGSLQIGSLQYILAGLKIGEKTPSKIDLRFDKPVLSF